MLSRFSSSLALAALLAAASPESLYQQALRSFSEQRYGPSESLLRDALRQRPHWFEARFLLGASLVSLERPAEAAVELEAAHTLNPAHLDCAKLLASEYLGLARPTETLGLVRPLLNAKNPDEELFLLAIEALEVRRDAGDAGEALRLSAQGLARFPRSARMLAWRGYSLREQGSLADARGSLQAALALAPAEAGWKVMLADVLRREGSHQQALALLDQVLRRAPADEEAVIAKSRTLEALSRPEEALRLLQTAVTAAPQAPQLRLELSRLYAKRGDMDRASQQAAEFRRLHGSQAERAIPAGLRVHSPASFQ